MQSTSKPAEPPRVVVSATFTAEPLEESLAFWAGKLGLPHIVAFAPFSQVFQELLDPGSLTARNASGANVILCRIEDLRDAQSGDDSRAAVERNAQALAAALRAAAGRSPVPHILSICPSSPALLANQSTAAFHAQIEATLMADLGTLGNVHLLGSAELARRYPVADYHNPHGAELGAVPYTPAYFAALGTAVARRLHRLSRNPHKVIVLDCDNTLWRGVCGEDSPEALGIDGPFRALQEFMVARQQEGMLLCLCSKNVEQDVDAVFAQRPDMPLKKEHLAPSKVNWLPKSQNIRALSRELNLGTDSFVFIDDNPVECAEVRASLPEVLTLQLPTDPAAIAQFLEHVWAFDTLQVTDADRKRTSMYLENVEREKGRTQAPSLRSFIESLGLQIKIAELSAETLPRSAQLTQRTNQFNFTTIRRGEAELAQRCASPAVDARVVHVSDRFGDYGQVGLVVTEHAGSELRVDTFLLSCRVLGRGVEHAVLAELGRLARKRGASHVRLLHVPTAKNAPARGFLESVAGPHKSVSAEGTVALLPAAVAEATVYAPDEETLKAGLELAATDDPKLASAPAAGPILTAALVEEITARLAAPAQVLEALRARNRHLRPDSAGRFVAPDGDLEGAIAEICREVLALDRVGATDNFFDLGGNSLQMMSVLSRLRDAFEVNLSAKAFFEKPTVRGLGHEIEALILRELEQMPG